MTENELKAGIKCYHNVQNSEAVRLIFFGKPGTLIFCPNDTIEKHRGQNHPTLCKHPLVTCRSS